MTPRSIRWPGAGSRQRCIVGRGQSVRAFAAVRLTSGVVETPNGVVRCRLTLLRSTARWRRILPELEGRVWPMRLQMLASGPHSPGLSATRDQHAAGLGLCPAASRWHDRLRRLPRRRWRGRAHGGHGQSPTAVQEALERRFREVLGVSPSVTHRWAATAGYTADGLPVLEQVRPGVWATGGYSGTGNLFGAACGRAVAKLALGSGARTACGLTTTYDATGRSTRVTVL